MIVQLFLDVAVVRALDEEQVLEQMRHAGLAGAFVTRADEIGDVDRDRAAAGVGKQQHTKSVGIGVFRDAGYRGPFVTPWGSVCAVSSKRTESNGGAERKGTLTERADGCRHGGLLLRVGTVKCYTEPGFLMP